MIIFSPDKADKLINLLETLFPDDNEDDAALHCAVVLMDLAHCDNCATLLLQHVIDLKNEFEQRCTEYENESTARH